MPAEQDVLKLREVQTRVERLLTYYREMGDKEAGFVHALETRLQGVATALESSAAMRHC